MGAEVADKEGQVGEAEEGEVEDGEREFKVEVGGNWEVEGFEEWGEADDWVVGEEKAPREAEEEELAGGEGAEEFEASVELGSEQGERGASGD